MGLFAIPVEDYCEQYRKEGRGVYEYKLNLPIEVKRELWRVMDEHLAEGIRLPYDYYHRGCAIACVKFVQEALSRYPRESYYLATKLPGTYMRDEKKTPEELFTGQLKKCGVDYFDFYLLHAVNRDIMKTFEEYKSYEYLSEQKKQVE
jgi:predicted aldo/keto reductase-like oxidoreductase